MRRKLRDRLWRTWAARYQKLWISCRQQAVTEGFTVEGGDGYSHVKADFNSSGLRMGEETKDRNS